MNKKLNKLINEWPQGVVYSSSWLKEQGISGQLLNRYKKSGWVSAIGNGAVKRVGDEIGYQGAIFALQNQKNLSIHVGAKSALELNGRLHFLYLNDLKVTIFGDWNEHLPHWFLSQDWGVRLDYHQTKFLPKDIELEKHTYKNFLINISSPLRAILECLFLVPEEQDLYECYQIMQGLTNLKPINVQQLLEVCHSIKVKRLFLYLAEKAGHSWFNYLDLSKINLGSGKRSISPGGIFEPKYQLILPEEFFKQ